MYVLVLICDIVHIKKIIFNVIRQFFLLYKELLNRNTQLYLLLKISSIKFIISYFIPNLTTLCQKIDQIFLNA